MSFFIKELIKIKVVCSNCADEFKVKLKQKRHPGEVVETYFNCDHCKHKYFSFATDPRVRELQQESKTEKSPFKKRAMIDEIKERMDKLKEELTGRR